MIETLLSKIGTALIGTIVFLTGVFSPQVPEQLGVALPSGTALFETSLAAPISNSATTMTITANSVRGGGSLSGYQCFTVDEGSAQAEYVCGTVSATTVTSLERGISPADGVTEDADLKFSHRRGASVKITDFPVIQRLVSQNTGSSTYASVLSYASAVPVATSSNNIPYASWVQSAITNQSVLVTTNQTVAGDKTFTGTSIFGTTTHATSTITSLTLASGTISRTPVIGTDITNKTYVDGVAVAGASNADETTKGIVEEATQAEVNAGTATGATGANLFIPPDKLAGGVAASMIFYNATSTTDAKVSAVPMTADDVLIMWAQFDSTSCITGSANFVTGSLTYKQSNLGATTTVSTVTNGHSAVGSCNAVAIGSVTATTSMTVNVTADISDGEFSALVAQLFVR